MEPYYGRRVKENGGACGISRAHQSMLLMVAMVATMAAVLLWEASPLVVSGVAQSSVLKVPSSSYESRTIHRSPAAEGTVEGSADPTETDAVSTVEETPLAEAEPDTTAEVPPITEDEPLEPEPKLFDTFSEEKNGTSIEENILPLPANETPLAENATVSAANATSEATVSAEEKAELTLGTAEATDEGFRLDADLDAIPSLNPLGAPSSLGENTVSEASNSTDTEEITQETVEREDREEKKCDYTVGKWVLDETRPLYSGLECKMWLSSGFSCRLNHHPDKLLDRYRWQPAECDLPVFNASSVLEMLRNKVIAFVGDSLGRQQLQSLMCMLTRGKNDTAISDIGTSFGFFQKRGERKPNGYAFRFDATNTTIMYKWSVTLARIQPLNPGDPETRNALHLDRPEEFIEKHWRDFDVLMLNSGHHWNGGKMKQNKFDFYLHGKPVNRSEELSRVPVAYAETVKNVVRWASNAIKATPEKIVYYRSLSPRHFRNGDWNTGGTCDTITFGKDNQIQKGMRVDPNAETAVLGTAVNLLNITSLSLERGETHVSKYGGGVGGQDCLHWCLPGIPDTWNEIFFAELARKFKRRGSSFTSRS